MYEPPLRAAATHRQMRQALDEFGGVPGVRRARGPHAAEHRGVDSAPSRPVASPDRQPAAVPPAQRRPTPSRPDTCAATRSISASPSQWVRLDARPAARKPVHRSAAEIGRLLELLDAEAGEGSWESGRLQALGYTYAFTGMRKCEALTLEHADIDLGGRSLAIRPKPDWRPKTLRSAARLPLAPPLAEVLHRWLPRTGCDWVFPGKRLAGPWTGGPPGRKALDEIRGAGERAGITGLTILGFRKSLGTLAKSWGISQLELKALLRHTSVETQRYYDEEDAELLRAAAAKIQFPRLVCYPA